MANTLLITKEAGEYFSFVVNGNLAEKVRNMRNDAFGIGDEVHIKTSNGANIVKEQKISVFDITLVVGVGTFTFTNIDTFLNKLIEVGYFDWVEGIGATGTGTGVSRFDDLADTFKYFGQNGKVVVVNESQLKLEAVTFYNYNKFTQLEDTPNSIAPNKILVGNADGTGFVFESKPNVIPPSLTSVGSFNYADASTAITPLAVVVNIPKVLTNDGTGTLTVLTNNPYGVSKVWDGVLNQFDFTQLSQGDQVSFRPSLEITTAAANQKIDLDLKFAIGSASEYVLPIAKETIKTTGLNKVSYLTKFDIAFEDIRTFPAQILLTSDADCTVKIIGWYVEIIRKSINVVDIHEISKTSELENDGDGTSPFATVTDISGKQDILTAGANITIEGNVISSTGGGGGGTVVDATDIVKGVVKLAGDLGGTADLPTVPALVNKVDKVAGERLINAGEITKLSNQSGTNTGDQDLTGLVHTNRTALDLVSGTNTGDETKASIEAKLTGEITTHTHPATAQNLSITVRKISTATTLTDADNGKVILLTASCTVTLPNGLITGFNATFSTMAGATLTYALGGSVTLINNTGTTMAEKLTHTIVNTGLANEYLTAGNL